MQVITQDAIDARAAREDRCSAHCQASSNSAVAGSPVSHVLSSVRDKILRRISGWPNLTILHGIARTKRAANLRQRPQAQETSTLLSGRPTTCACAEMLEAIYGLEECMATISIQGSWRHFPLQQTFLRSLSDPSKKRSTKNCLEANADVSVNCG